MTEEERKSYEILYEKIIFVDKYRMLKPHWIKFHNYIEKLQKEIEEKTTIIMAGAEKVKQLEKEFITKQEIKDNYIPKDKIREKIEDYKNEIECEKSYLEQGIICEEEYKDRVKVYNSYIFILNKLLEEE